MTSPGSEVLRGKARGVVVGRWADRSLLAEPVDLLLLESEFAEHVDGVLPEVGYRPPHGARAAGETDRVADELGLELAGDLDLDQEAVVLHLRVPEGLPEVVALLLVTAATVLTLHEGRATDLAAGGRHPGREGDEREPARPIA